MIKIYKTKVNCAVLFLPSLAFLVVIGGLRVKSLQPSEKYTYFLFSCNIVKFHPIYQLSDIEFEYFDVATSESKLFAHTMIQRSSDSLQMLHYDGGRIHPLLEGARWYKPTGGVM